MAASEPITKERIASMIIPHLPSWGAKPLDITYAQLNGWSNHIFSVTALSPVVPQKVILRIFPQKFPPASLMSPVNKKKEQAVFSELTKSEDELKLYYCCDTYRIERFIEGETLSIFEVGNKMIAREIAIKLCDYHHSQALEQVMEMCGCAPGKKLTFVENFLLEWLPIFVKNYHACLGRMTRKDHKELMVKLGYFTTDAFQQEYKKILGELSKSEIVVGHNDLNATNIMRKLVDKEKLIFIDYEYTTYNYRGYDLAGFIVESGIDNAYPEHPYFKPYAANKYNEEETEAFLRHYLARDATLKKKPDLKAYVEQELPKMKKEVKLAEPPASAMWAVWCINTTKWAEFGDDQSAVKLIYAVLRFDMYLKAKEEALKITL